MEYSRFITYEIQLVASLLANALPTTTPSRSSSAQVLMIEMSDQTAIVSQDYFPQDSKGSSLVLAYIFGDQRRGSLARTTGARTTAVSFTRAELARLPGCDWG